MPGKGKRGTKRQRKRMPFRVFEAGSGINPVGLFRKAAFPRSRKRQFVGVEQLAIERGGWFDLLGLTLREAGLEKIPENVKWLSGRNAVEEIRRVPRRSQSVVIASYFLNNLKPRDALNFLADARKALRPGGRMLIVDDKIATRFYQQAAKSLHMGFYCKEIPDKDAAKSDSESIRERSSPKKRMERFRRIVQKPVKASRPGATIEEAFQDLKKDGLVKTRADTVKPTLIYLRKPRLGETGVRRGKP
jgi:hypothetical protein